MREVSHHADVVVNNKSMFEYHKKAHLYMIPIYVIRSLRKRLFPHRLFQFVSLLLYLVLYSVFLLSVFSKS